MEAWHVSRKLVLAFQQFVAANHPLNILGILPAAKWTNMYLGPITAIYLWCQVLCDVIWPFLQLANVENLVSLLWDFQLEICVSECWEIPGVFLQSTARWVLTLEVDKSLPEADESDVLPEIYVGSEAQSKYNSHLSEIQKIILDIENQTSCVAQSVFIWACLLAKLITSQFLWVYSLVVDFDLVVYDEQ